MSAPTSRTSSARAVLRRIAPGLETLTRYQLPWLRSDLAAGLSVAAVALPVGIAYSDLAHVPAVVGMYAAIFPLFAYALFGSSRQLMTGPDAATCIMVAASLGPLAGGDPERYQALMVVLTLCIGVIYVGAGIARLGFLASFLSLPILTGFLNGIALIILAGQLKKLFGYEGEAGDFLPQVTEFFTSLDRTHGPTLLLGSCLLVGMVLLRRLLPRVPGALVVVIAGIAAVALFGLDERGVAVLGAVPKGLPGMPRLPEMDAVTLKTVVRDATALVLVSFTSGILTAKSFAQRNGYEVTPNQELIAFGACNLASGLAQGFPVTGADSRTAVNNATGGKSQMVGVVAGGAMLLVLFFLTEPLGRVPIAALAAVIMVSAVGLFDVDTLRTLAKVSRRELAFSIGTTLGVLLLGVLPGVLIAVGLSLIGVLERVRRPDDAVLGRVPGMKGFHEVGAYPEVRTRPGLLVYRFDADYLFFNVDSLKDRILARVAAADVPVEWIILDLSPVTWIDVTAVLKLRELREYLEAQSVFFALARVKPSIWRRFEHAWVDERRATLKGHVFDTLKTAVHAFEHRDRTNPKLADEAKPEP